MDKEILRYLVYNTALLLVLGVLYEIILTKTYKNSSITRLISGLIIGFIAIIIMANPWELEPGLIFDTRSVLLSLTGLFFGLSTSLSAMTLTALYRIYQGGIGALTGTIVIIATTIVGIIWRNIRKKRKEGFISAGELYLFGIAAHVVMLLCMLTLPWKTATNVLEKITLPVLLIYPAGTVFLGRLLSYQMERRISVEMLKESEKDYRSLFENMVEGFAYCRMIFRNNEAVDYYHINVNPAFEKITGLKNAKGKYVSELIPGLKKTNPDLFEKYARVALSGAPEHFEIYIHNMDMWFNISVYSPKNEHFIVIFENITERKNSEIALRQKDELIRLTGAMAKVGGWEFNAETFKGTWTDEVARIHDLDPADETNVDKGISFYHGEHRQKIENAIKNAIEKGQSYDLELELISAKGINKWVRTIGIPIKSGEKVVKVRGIFHDVTERVKAEQILRESEKRFRTVVETAPEAIFIQINHCFAYVNKSALDLFGAESPEQLIGKPMIERFHPDFRDKVIERIKKLNDKFESVAAMEEICMRIDGTQLCAEFLAVPFTYLGEDGALVFARDISERKRAESEKAHLQEQLMQAKKLESIGRLAGGIAHDFNNSLLVILASGEIILDSLPENSPIRDPLSEIIAAAEHSKNLTKQMLAFGRKQILEMKPINLHEVIFNIEKMIKRLLGEDILLSIITNKEEIVVNADTTQLEQTLLNLSLNARDAMPEGGALTIETDTVTLDENYFNTHPDIQIGEYAMITVSDTGYGMSEETLKQIFDPFFTTKEKGKGTGLGLATVFGIIKQHGGSIWAYSEINKGTTFKIYLPRIKDKIVSKQPEKKAVIDSIPGGETIMVVEDEESVRKLTCMILSNLGYKILEAKNLDECLKHAKESEKIDLLLTDVIMPETNGKQIYEKVSAICPDIKALFMSGYTENVIAHHGVLDSGCYFISKPFTKKDLKEKICEILKK